MKKLIIIQYLLLLIIPCGYGYPFYHDAPRDELTAEERQWLSEHNNEVVIPLTRDTRPMFFIQKDGNKAGLIYDIIWLIKKKLNINIKYLVVDDWDDAVKRYQNREFDVIFGLQKTVKRSLVLNFTEPFVKTPYVIVVRNSYEGKADLEHLSGKRVSVVKGYLFHKVLTEQYPRIIIDPVTNELEGLRHVAYGMSDAVAVNQFYALHLMEHHGLANLKFGSETGFINELAVAVRKDQSILFSIMQKGLASVTEQEKSDIIRKWYNFEPPFFYRPRFWLAISVFVFVSVAIVVGFIIWNRTLRKRVLQQTGEIANELSLRKKAEEELQSKNQDLLKVNDDLKSAVEKLEASNAAFEAINNDLISAQLEVLKSENLLKSIFRAAPTGIGMVKDRIIQWGNELLCVMTGYSIDELVGQSARILYPDQEEYDFVGKEKYRQINEKGTGTVETKWITRGGEIIDVLLSSTPLDQKDLSYGVTFTALNITERKEMERDLRESEGRFRQLILRSPVSMVLLDDKLKLIMLNEKFTSLFGYTREDFHDYSSLYDRIIPDVPVEGRQFKQKDEEEGSRRDCIYQDCIALCRDGSERIVDIEEAHFSSGSVISFIDMTEYRKAEKAIRANLKEKELLLKEIHHRVKNNMQVISSLLHLQMDSIKDPNDVELFMKSESRIKAMALVHESLYKADDLSSIDFEPFIYGLIANLFDSFRMDKDNIQLEIKVDDVKLGIDRAIPCSQIINELVMNSLKYAFPDNKTGLIEINLYKRDGNYNLIVADNGVGLPEGIDVNAARSLGLQIVVSLTAQLKGSIRYEGPPGSRFTIIFPE